MKNRLTTTLAALAVGCLAWAATPDASAIPINGTITFDSPTNGSVTTTAGVTTVAFPSMVINSTTLDYTTAGATGTPASFTNFSFSGPALSPTLIGAPINLWSVGGFSFQLTGLTGAIIGDGAYIISGVGIAYGPGSFTATAGTFTLSGTGANPSFTFLASTTATGVAVPDGGMTVALLGMTLAGIEGMRRKFAKA